MIVISYSNVNHFLNNINIYYYYFLGRFLTYDKVKGTKETVALVIKPAKDIPLNDIHIRDTTTTIDYCSSSGSCIPHSRLDESHRLHNQ
jgi:hypothetical protein